MAHPKGRVLIIAGSDCSGGAGVQGDIKTVTALGGYAAGAITAVTVQNTLGVSAVHEVPAEIVRGQIVAVMSDIGADAWKLGMLGSAACVRIVAEAYDAVGQRAPLVLDPVMIAKGGASLLAPDAVEAMAAMLAPRAMLVTPNAPEAEALTGVKVADLDGQIDAAEALVEELGAYAALVKGGHIDGATVRDVLLTREGYRVFESERIETKATHGTGCALASAIAAYIAQGAEIVAAVEQARVYLREAMLNAPGFGKGCQPLGHNWRLTR